MSFVLPSVAVLLSLASAPIFAAKIKVDDVYREHCASCHGVSLDGGSGGSLLDRVWNHGATDPDLATSISVGLPDAGMPGFGNALSPEVVRALVVYIREKENASFRATSSSAFSLPVGPIQTQHTTFDVERVVSEGLETPWSLAFLPDGLKLVTERPGRLRVLDDAWKLAPEPVAGIPRVVVSNQGGLLDVVPSPDFSTSGWIYLTYAAPLAGTALDTKTSMTKVVRGRLKGNEWSNEEVIFESDPVHYSTSGVHFGSRIVFDSGYLFVTVGERAAATKAQDRSAPNGKILRLFPDGLIPSDNPFFGQGDALDAVWSYGHRNPQGLVVDPTTHTLYATEHGPRGGDELNRIRKGANYGWPLVCFGMNYDGSPLTALTEMPGVDGPLHHWTPSIATCGLAFYSGDKFPAWKGDLFVGGLKGGLRRVRIRDGAVVEDELILGGVGRVRDVRGGPDGFLYVVLNAPDSILRIVPASAGTGDAK